ncbi:hypothetical protein NP493_1055g00000 [Ridgeia piscesae]|uniref:Uncharacterized protein n=1 Tax=Ridgeia piscesae TaxID=27915 RepID=A0AAD9KHW7_RIDPI|nr:hypothetical protein NP493_1055g00000 [Ridgeia piscesae]
MSLEANSWRYENMKTKAGTQCKRSLEKLKIKRENIYNDREDAEIQMKKDAFKSYWRETMELTANNKKMGTDLKQKQAEVVLSGKASMLVRKAALKKLFEDEYVQFQTELNQQNKAFYIKRE